MIQISHAEELQIFNVDIPPSRKGSITPDSLQVGYAK